MSVQRTERMYTHIFLLVVLPGDYAVNTMHEQFTKLLNLVAFPIVYSMNEVVQSLF
jgi:hypothetical protein